MRGGGRVALGRAMGQEAGKPDWPRPVGGYQTITGRRYGRRHACVGFRPSLNSRDRGSSPIFQVSPGLLDEPLSENTGTGEPICRSVSTQTFEGNTSSFSLFPYVLEGRQISWNSANTYGKSEDLAEYASGEHNDLNDQNGIAFVNIDSYKPDSSDGEEDDAQDSFSLAREEAGVFQGTLDNMLSELEKGIESFTDLESQLSALNHSISRECCEAAGPMPLMTYYSGLACSNNRTFKLSAEDQAIPKSNPSDVNYEIQQMQSIVDAGFRTPIAIPNEFNVSDGKIDEGSLPGCVVRPKIRKQNTAKQLERVKLLPNGVEESEFAEVQQSCAECGSKEEMNSSIFFDSRDYGGHRKDTEIDLRKNAAAQEQKSVLDFWDEFEDCSRHLSVSHRDEYSSEWSDGEWSTTVSAYFTATEKGQSSSDESWATVPDKEEGEPEVQSSSSGVEEENTNFFFQGGQQAFPDSSLEEGEIPWLQYRGGVESSSDEENDLISDFMRPGFFLLDGNNNLEDDSSVSEDLDVEWRLLDEFGDGLGLAQAFPYVNPQYLAFVAIEEHLQQAMENALAHLESLGVEVEQAHPPATKETIECLPQIIVTDDHNGQEQRCTVCCSEYVKDEIMTELPCHHLFHKLCVTLWLQESGTCPVCRHVLAPVLPEAAAANVPVLSNHDSASSVHSATGTSD
ncbi:E3 ubiquitin-protein ligase Praja-2 isoform X2 [Athene noctua]|uniref:E3 ubiquitin-protein ligase Praja-2 isoform X2 n=1 Tax=Athene noctua TaxID=126797 RepID=UPI003EB8AA55